ncbi:MAG: hypothetical protein JST00_37210 [Deltaproteobacteria bacterium]|nr:hypothetical protein [Deltaproteobacteria bacterium]
MKQSLHRTWAALAVAALAVLAVLVFVVRDFVRDVAPECPGGVRLESSPGGATRKHLDLVDAVDPKAEPGVPRLVLRFDSKRRRGADEGIDYANVRFVRAELEKDGRECDCGHVSMGWAPELRGDDPTSLKLYRHRETGLFVVKNGRDEVATIRATHEPRRVFQPQRVFAVRNLPSAVVLLALGALGIALLRSRRAISYAVRLHGWTEATLTPAGRIEDLHGGILANADSSLTSTRRAWPIPVGEVLVDPKALSSSLYREMPVVGRGAMIKGGHARWTTSTMVQLRDARALAILSCMCTAAACVARVLGG